jgi:hypothetical protein
LISAIFPCASKNLRTNLRSSLNGAGGQDWLMAHILGPIPIYRNVGARTPWESTPSKTKNRPSRK